MPARSLLKLARAAGLAVLFCAGLLLYLRNRAVELPRPTGPHPVGRRIEYFRDVALWIWYPAKSRSGSAPYLPVACRWYASHSWFSQNLDAVQTNAGLDPPAATESPELIFLPADKATPPFYSSLLEDLASRGYKVIAIHSTAESRTREARAVMDREQTARFGVLGHSQGGAAAAELCRVDSRCVAAVDLDGRLWNPVATDGLKRPLLMLLSEPSFVDTGAEMTGYERVLATAPGSELLRVNGMRRLNFTDWPFLFNPLLRLSPLFGSLTAERSATITRAYASAFFDRYLRNENPPLLQGPSPDYREVVWRR